MPLDTGRGGGGSNGGGGIPSGGGNPLSSTVRPPMTIPGTGAGGGGGSGGGGVPGSGGGFSPSSRPAPTVGIGSSPSSPASPARPSPGIGTLPGNDIAGEAATKLAEQLGYYLGGVLQGLEGRQYTYAPDPRFIRQDSLTSDGARDGLRAREVIKNTLKKVPSFEIPQVKIPEVKLPQIPKVELPKLPEIKIPELPKFPKVKLPQLPSIPKIPNPFPKLPPLKPTPKPKPRPTPATKADELRELPPGQCGDVIFYFAYVDKVIGERYDENTGTFISITLPATIEEYLGKWRELVPSTREASDSQLLGSGGGTGTPQYIQELNYDIQINGSNTLSLNGSNVGFPYYRHISYFVRVRNGDNTSAVLNNLSRNRTPDVYDYAVGYPERDGCTIVRPNPESNPPPEPPPRCKDKCMCCCNDDNKQNNNELLKLILRRIGNLPAQIPNKLTDRSSGRRTINSLSEFMAHQIRLLDDIAGYFPLEIEIEDSNLTKEGNQTESIKVPNLAEALRELIGLALVLRTESSANLSATLRALIEAGSAKQAAIVAHDYAQANAEFLGYEIKQVEKNVAFAFTPGKQKIEEMLQETMIKIKSIENVDKQTFEKEIYPLLEMASRWNAQNWRNLGRGNGGEALKDLLNLGLNIVTKSDEFVAEQRLENPNNKPKSDFDDFLEEVENGFNTQDGITKPESPYGYPYNERPKIRQLGNTYEEDK